MDALLRFVSPRVSGVLLVGILGLVSCNSMPSWRFGLNVRDQEDIPDVTPQNPLLNEFFPETYVTGVKRIKGQSVELFAPECFAIWLGPDVAAFRRTKAADSGTKIDPTFENAISRIVENYIVIECHMISAFPDASIAYDAVKLRGITPYLGAAEGKHIAPLQMIMTTPIHESQEGALKRFERLVYLVFPKQITQTQQMVIAPKAPSAALFLDGFGTSYCFEWASSMPAPPSPNPTLDASKRMLQKGYTDGYAALVRVLRATE